MSRPARRVYAGGAGRFDPRRNTSAVQPVPPGALDEAKRALRRWREDNPDHADWIERGAPRLSVDEHVRLFGHAGAPRGASAPPAAPQRHALGDTMPELSW